MKRAGETGTGRTTPTKPRQRGHARLGQEEAHAMKVGPSEGNQSKGAKERSESPRNGRGSSGSTAGATGLASHGRDSRICSGTLLSPSPESPSTSGKVHDDRAASRTSGRAGWWKSPSPDPERARAGKPARATRQGNYRRREMNQLEGDEPITVGGGHGRGVRSVVTRAWEIPAGRQLRPVSPPLP